MNGSGDNEGRKQAFERINSVFTRRKNGFSN